MDLKQFVKKTNESNLLRKNKNIVLSINFILLYLFFCIIFTISIISTPKSTLPALLSMIGIIILTKEAKRNDEENNQKYE